MEKRSTEAGDLGRQTVEGAEPLQIITNYRGGASVVRHEVRGVYG